jgi:hypothetical protein
MRPTQYMQTNDIGSGTCHTVEPAGVRPIGGSQLASQKDGPRQRWYHSDGYLAIMSKQQYMDDM